MVVQKALNTAIQPSESQKNEFCEILPIPRKYLLRLVNTGDLVEVSGMEATDLIIEQLGELAYE